MQRNFATIRDRVAPRRVWCVVKADAYGHGGIEVARRLQDAGAAGFGVATVDEGVELRDGGVTGDVLVMAGVEPLRAAVAEAVAEAGLSVAVWSVETARSLGSAASNVGTKPVGVHLKVDTGMGRLGVRFVEPLDGLVETARAIASIEGVRLEGVFSNLAAADAPSGDPAHDHTASQIDRFARLCAALAAAGLLPPHRHLSNSAAIQAHPESWNGDWCNGVRPGLALYGAGLLEGVEPAMSWHSAIAAVRNVPEGWPLGYGGVRRATRDSALAVVPVGYHDGWPRSLSDRAEVLVAGQRAKVVGAISMDLTLVDITGISDAHAGDPVVLLGSDGLDGADQIRVEEVAGWADSIAHEILCRVGGRVPRRFGGTAS